MAHYGLQHLPTPLLVNILSRVSSRAEEVVRLASVCKPFAEAALLLPPLRVILCKRDRGQLPGATALILRMPAIRDLIVVGAPRTPTSILREIAGHCGPQLRSLDIGTYQLTSSLELSAFPPLIKLQRLSLLLQTLSQSCLAAVLKLCPALVSLDVEFSSGSLSCIQSPLLEHLRLRHLWRELDDDSGSEEDGRANSDQELCITAPRLADLALDNVAEAITIVYDPPAHAACLPPLRVLHVKTPYKLRQLAFASGSGGAGTAAGTRLPALSELDLEAMSLPLGAVMGLLESGETSQERVRLISRICSTPREHVPPRLQLPSSRLASLTVNSSIMRYVRYRGDPSPPRALSFRHLAFLEIQFDDFEGDQVAMLEDIVEENHASLRQVRLNFGWYVAMLQQPGLDLIAAFHMNPALQESLLAEVVTLPDGGAPRGPFYCACQDLKKRHSHLQFELHFLQIDHIKRVLAHSCRPDRALHYIWRSGEFVEIRC